MPRPSVQSTRLSEIIDAAVKCVAHYGLEGVTLDRIAAETGLKRPLIRHHAGNREEIINAVVTHVLSGFAELTKTFANALPAKNRSFTAVEYLFDDQTHSDPAEMMVFQSIVAASDRFPKEREALLLWLGDFTMVIVEAIKRDFLDVDKESAEIVAHGIVAIYFNIDSLAPLQPPQEWRRYAKKAAQLLLRSLESHVTT
ncbi:TetR/AcrR family transcriptional regulator [Pseudovibrio sp. Tun.PSC04-5.I4]|uniref:TetR/AcrR family transcriptional regulator n=1 Tax=Pseudovibrio sp. Tun.PSC04-5.I4 TaxID=1798213 RepID=UPI000881A52A|nr:TetR/AcrR family transcriptional regulator [Pseudovibrio sp. Tun.PSC04-5.I4]SDQ87903.1 DNA-binding transcriptional regulator, AcrR family [Pseudovibrio sp. Tun.PSC04-5.I4]